MNLTYRELLESLLSLSEEDLDKTVTVLREDGEFQAVVELGMTSENDILDEDHPFLRLDYLGFMPLSLPHWM